MTTGGVQQVGFKAVADVRDLLKGFAVYRRTMDQLVASTERAVERSNALMRKGMQITFAGMDIQALGRTATILLTAPFVAASGASLKFATDFSQNMRNVDAIAKLTADGLERMSQQVRAIAISNEYITATSIDLAAGLYDIVSSGYKGAEALNILEVAAMGATAGLTNLKVSSQSLVAVLNTGLPDVYNAQYAMDVMFKTVDIGVITFEELATSIGYVLPAAIAAQLEFTELGAAIASATQVMRPQAAIYGLAQLITSIVSPTKQASDEAAKWGIELGALALQQKGLMGVLSEIAEKTRGNIELQATLVGEVRAQRVMWALLRDSGRQYADTLDRMSEATEGQGATLEALIRQAQGAGVQFALLRKSATELGISLGETILPAALALTSALRDGAKVVSSWNTGVKTSILVIGAFGAAVGPVTWMVGKLLSAWGGTIYAAGVFVRWLHAADVALIDQVRTTLTAAGAHNAMTASLGRELAAILANNAATVRLSLVQRSAGGQIIQNTTLWSANAAALVQNTAAQGAAAAAALEQVTPALLASDAATVKLILTQQAANGQIIQNTALWQANASAVAAAAAAQEAAAAKAALAASAMGALQFALKALAVAAVAAGIVWVINELGNMAESARTARMSVRDLVDEYRELEAMAGEAQLGAMFVGPSGEDLGGMFTIQIASIHRALFEMPQEVERAVNQAASAYAEGLAESEERIEETMRRFTGALQQVEDPAIREELKAGLVRLIEEGAEAMTEAGTAKVTAMQRQLIRAWVARLDEAIAAGSEAAERAKRELLERIGPLDITMTVSIDAIIDPAIQREQLRLKQAENELEQATAGLKKEYDALGLSVQRLQYNMMGLRMVLENAKKEFQATKLRISELKDELKEARDRLKEFAEPSLVGMQALDDQIFETTMRLAQLRLEMLAVMSTFAPQLVAARREVLLARLALLEAGDDAADAAKAGIRGIFDIAAAMREELRTGIPVLRQFWEWQQKQLERGAGGAGAAESALEQALDEAQRRLEIVRVRQELAMLDLEAAYDEESRARERLEFTKKLTFDRQLRDLKAMADAVKEITFAEAISGIRETQAEIGRLERALATETETLERQRGKVDALQESYDNMARSLAMEQMQRAFLKLQIDEMSLAYETERKAIMDVIGGLENLKIASADLAKTVGDIQFTFEQAAGFQFGGGAARGGAGVTGAWESQVDWMQCALDALQGVPEFGSGGVVPGPVGRPTIIRAHGGERISQASQTYHDDHSRREVWNVNLSSRNVSGGIAQLRRHALMRRLTGR